MIKLKRLLGDKHTELRVDPSEIKAVMIGVNGYSVILLGQMLYRIDGI